jgi:hypothetical protein
MFGILYDGANDDGIDDGLLSAIFKAPLSINSKRINSVSDTLSLRQLSTASIAQRWEIETGVYAPHGSHKMFIQSVVNDINQIFWIRPPLPIKRVSQSIGLYFGVSAANSTARADLAFSQGVGTATAGGATRGANSIRLNVPSNAACLLGDFVRFGSDPKVYLITDVTNISGSTLLAEIFPALKNDAPDNTAAYYGLRATMRVRYSADKIAGITYTDGILEDPGVIRLVEAI